MELLIIIILIIGFIFLVIMLTSKKEQGKPLPKMHKAEKEYISVLEARKQSLEQYKSGQISRDAYITSFAKLTAKFYLVHNDLKDLGYSEEELGDFHVMNEENIPSYIKNMKQSKSLTVS